MRYLSVLLFVLIASQLAWTQEKKSLIDFFLPMKPVAPLVSEGIWGAPGVLPRDTANGLEDATLRSWCYWDGSIVKDDQGLYHMYASTWEQTYSHSQGWHLGSKGVHAVSEEVSGPYVRQGLLWPDWKEGAGHNVVGLRMHDGRYATVTSEITQGEVFVSDTPNGPFKLLGRIKIDYNGFDPGLARYDDKNEGALRGGVLGHMSNVQILLRPDGKYMIIARSTAPLLSENGILGPYKIMGDRVYKGMADVPQTKMEDPSVWYSGGMYHMILNHHGIDSTYHFTSPDGIHDWKNRGIAFSKEANIFRYTDGTVNQWNIVQRMTVYVEDGHPTHFLFSVIDVHKGLDKPNDKHGSKIIVVPFDGKAFDDYMQRLVSEENSRN